MGWILAAHKSYFGVCDPSPFKRGDIHFPSLNKGRVIGSSEIPRHDDVFGTNRLDIRSPLLRLAAWRIGNDREASVLPSGDNGIAGKLDISAVPGLLLHLRNGGVLERGMCDHHSLDSHPVRFAGQQQSVGGLYMARGEYQIVLDNKLQDLHRLWQEHTVF